MATAQPDESTTVMPPKILRKREIRQYLSLSISTVYRLEAQGLFPSRIRIGPGLVGWLKDEIDAWVAERAAERQCGKAS